MYSSLFTIVSLLLFFSFLLVKTKKQTRLPPGPWRLPFIGSLHHLIGRGLLHPTLRNLAERYGPLIYLQLGEIPVVIISSSTIAKELLTTHDLAFADRPQSTSTTIIFYNNKDIVFSPYDNYCKQMRKICKVQLFSAKMVKSFSTIRKDEISSLISSIRSTKGSPVNMTEKIFWFTNSVTCSAAFGKMFKDRDEFIKLLKDILILASGFYVTDLFPSWKLLHKLSGAESRLMNAHRKVDEIMEDILKEHLENKANRNKGIGDQFGGEDLVDVLLKVMEDAELECPITNDHIKAVILDIFIAGSETSSTITIWVLSEMMKNPNIMAKAQKEVRQVFRGKRNYDDEEEDLEKLTYLKLVIKETLRLHTPAPLLGPRECREQTNIDGYTIPLKTKILVNAWALARDPESWHDPESFIPERFENSSIDFMGNHFEFIPFGAGRRMCPGVLFGLTNVELSLAQLLYHFEWELPYGMNPKDLDMTETYGLSGGKQRDLYLAASCKVFHEVANERYIYQNATLSDFPIEPSWEKQKQEKINKVASFLELCRECGNTEALYRKGVMDFFKDDMPELASEFLKRAAKGGHIGAFYVIGIIMVFMGGEFRQKGVKLIGKMKKTKQLRKITRECRKKLIEILTHIWVKNPLVLGQSPNRCTIQHQRIRRNGWPHDCEDEDENMDVHCDACSCDVEIDHIISVLPKVDMY